MEVTTKKYEEPKDESAIAVRPKAKAERVVDVRHNHPRGVVEIVAGYDDNNKRIIQQVPARQRTYIASCPGCIHADKARMAAEPSSHNIETTMFLVPEPEYDGMIARAYVNERYPEAQNIVHAFSAEKLSYVRGAQVVVITRRGKNGRPGPRYKRTKDEEGTFYDAPVPPETYLSEIVESDPVIVEDCITVVAGNMYTEQSADFSELIARLAERAEPFRIAPPNAPDKVFVMRLNA